MTDHGADLTEARGGSTQVTSSLARALPSRTISGCLIRWSVSACCGPTPTAPTGLIDPSTGVPYATAEVTQ